MVGKDIISTGYEEATSSRGAAATPQNGAIASAFHNCVSAELSALLSALRNEQTVRGATVYCTDCPHAFPATVLSKSGIRRVVFFALPDGRPCRDPQYIAHSWT